MDEAGRDDCGEDGTVALLFDANAVEEGLYIHICCLYRDRGLRGVEKIQVCTDLFGNGSGVIARRCKRFGAEVKSTKILGRDDEHRRIGKKERPVTQWRERERGLGFDSSDGPSQADEGDALRQRNCAVVAAHEPWPGKRRCELTRAINHAADDGGVFVIGGGYGVDTEQSNTECAAFQGNAVNVGRTIVVHR